MNRRAVLSIAIAGFAFSGCLGRIERDGDISSDNTSVIQRREFQFLEYDEFSEDPNEGPQIEFDTAGNQVTVTGRLFVGSGNCKEAQLDDIRYEKSEDQLTVIVTHGKSGNHPNNNPLGLGSCTEDMSSDGYEVTVTTEGSLPTRTTAIERDAENDEQTTTTATPTNRRSQYMTTRPSDR